MAVVGHACIMRPIKVAVGIAIQHAASFSLRRVTSLSYPLSLSQCGPPQTLVVRSLNRLMMEPSELISDVNGNAHAVVKADDPRAIHVRSILGCTDGSVVRAGIIDGGKTDSAQVNWLPTGELGLKLGRLKIEAPAVDRPNVDIILALPRPRALERILPVASSLGVGTIVISNAAKVDKGYFGSHLFRDSFEMRNKLVEGLMQSGDTALPRVIVAKRLKVFLEDNVDTMFPNGTHTRVVAHPRRSDDEVSVPCMSEILDRSPERKKVLIAIGPDGGWEEPYELDLLNEHGFHRIALPGTRVLRSDVAVSVLMGLAHDWLA